MALEGSSRNPNGDRGRDLESSDTGSRQTGFELRDETVENPTTPYDEQPYFYYHYQPPGANDVMGGNRVSREKREDVRPTSRFCHRGETRTHTRSSPWPIAASIAIPRRAARRLASHSRPTFNRICFWKTLESGRERTNRREARTAGPPAELLSFDNVVASVAAARAVILPRLDSVPATRLSDGRATCACWRCSVIPILRLSSA